MDVTKQLKRDRKKQRGRARQPTVQPAADHEHWAPLCAPLLEHFATVLSATWDELDEWRVESSAVGEYRLRNMVAWLEIQGTIYTKPNCTPTVWLYNVTHGNAKRAALVEADYHL